MTQRITLKNLEAVTARINRATGSPEQPFSTNNDGKGMHANIGCYHISQQYGGYSLHRMVTEDGAVKDVLSCSHIPARELYIRMHIYLTGLEDARKGNKV